MTVWLFLLDAVLALGACLRLTRFVVADDVPGRWWVKDPLRARAEREDDDSHPSSGRWVRYLDGLSCPFCVSVWFAAFVILTLVLAGGPGEAADWWRIPAGFLTLAWLTGHIAARSGDTDN